MAENAMTHDITTTAGRHDLLTNLAPTLVRQDGKGGHSPASVTFSAPPARPKSVTSRSKIRDLPVPGRPFSVTPHSFRSGARRCKAGELHRLFEPDKPLAGVTIDGKFFAQRGGGATP